MRGAVQLVTSVGARLPAASTAVGKALLAFAPEAEWPAALAAELASVRTQGYAVDRGETVAGVTCVAAPILDHGRRPLAALGITYLDARTPELERVAGPRLAAVAAELSGRSGAAA